jgi:hypothetical protein
MIFLPAAGQHPLDGVSADQLGTMFGHKDW